MLVLDWRRDIRRRLVACLAVLTVICAVSFSYQVAQRVEQAWAPSLGPLRTVPTDVHAVALTYVVEWGDKVPLTLLQTLAAAHVSATFFVSQAWAMAHPDIVNQMVHLGFDVGGAVHLTGTPQGATVDDERLQDVLQALRASAVRMPHHVWSDTDPEPSLLEVAAQRGVTLVRPTAAVNEADLPYTDAALAQLAPWLRPGAILNLPADDDAASTVTLTQELLRQLQHMGLRAISLDQLVSLAQVPAPLGP